MSNTLPPSGAHQRTIAFYDANAADFAERTCDIDMSDLYQPFLALVPDGGEILDAGCGPGRDAAEFVRRGYRVTAFDASEAMVRLCRSVSGTKVRHHAFDQLEDEDAFDGIWASASLLHVPRRGLPEVLRRLARALRPGGALYMSFKQGSAEELRGERLFTDLEERSLAARIDECPGLYVERTWVSAAKQTDKDLPPWVNALARRGAGADA